MLKRLPVDVSSIEKMVSDNYLYIDKTEQIYNLITQGSYYFLSRPRRFGKSVLISTLKEIFLGNKELSGKLLYLVGNLSEKYGPKSVVISIDEYDKPLLDHLRTITIAREQQAQLKSFYEAVKSLDPLTLVLYHLHLLHL